MQLRYAELDLSGIMVLLFFDLVHVVNGNLRSCDTVSIRQGRDVIVGSLAFRLLHSFALRDKEFV